MLEVPPLTFGWTLIAGWMVMVGCTLITAAATALVMFLPCDRRTGANRAWPTAFA